MNLRYIPGVVALHRPAVGCSPRTGPRLRDRWRFYRSARRSGIELPMLEAFRQLGSLSRWVDGPER